MQIFIFRRYRLEPGSLQEGFSRYVLERDLFLRQARSRTFVLAGCFCSSPAQRVDFCRRNAVSKLISYMQIPFANSIRKFISYMQIPFHPIPNFLQRVYPRIGPIRAITEEKSNFKRHTAAKQYRIDVAERKRGPQWRVPLGQMTRHFVIF